MPAPVDGDILVSKVGARLEHEVDILPSTHVGVFRKHDAAVAKARELAKARHVDAWLTEDLCHFMNLASHRPLRQSHTP